MCHLSNTYITASTGLVRQFWSHSHLELQDCASSQQTMNLQQEQEGGFVIHVKSEAQSTAQVLKPCLLNDNE